MRIATWNVNSIRTRVDRVVDWMVAADIDVLAMQETKCTDDKFPAMDFASAGYDVATVGYNQWNGVAIASRVGLSDIQTQFASQPGFTKDPDAPPAVEARALAATCNGVQVWSLYVPNGRSLDDPHLDYKLKWLAALHDQSQAWLADNPTAQVALTGDWNIAPTDEDVWDPDFFAGKTHTSPAERAAFAAFIDGGYSDVVRPFAPGPGTYTYWDYTQLRFPKKQGMRIDFALCSPALASRVSHAEIVREQRKGKQPSDHAPVMFTIE